MGEHMLSIGRRIMLRFAVVLTTCFLVGSSAHAQQTIGDLFTACEAYERGARRSGTQVSLPNMDAAMCFGYFTAVHQLAYFYTVEAGGQKVKALRAMCLPNKGPNITQLIRMFMAYARANPQTHHEGAVFGVLNAINPAFPCND
jgi:hypothetical protein